MYFNEDDEAHVNDLLEGYQAECERLEKENKKLKTSVDAYEKCLEFIKAQKGISPLLICIIEETLDKVNKE